MLAEVEQLARTKLADSFADGEHDRRSSTRRPAR